MHERYIETSVLFCFDTANVNMLGTICCESAPIWIGTPSI